MNICDTTDFIYPMKADVYYPIITQNQYGQPNKDWVFDRTVILNATPVGGAGTEDIKPAEFLQYENKLVSRTKSDIRVSSNNENYALSNILVTNVRLSNDVLVYKETAGPRNGRGTIYEIATLEPYTNPFGSIEYYKVLLRRTENQAVSD
jgi:hypothetical protein